MNIEFAWPWLFLALPIPLLIYFLVPKAKAIPPQAARMPLYFALQQDKENKNKEIHGQKNIITIVLLIIIWLLLILAATRPQIIGDPIAMPLKGRNLMLAVDISGSMREQDMFMANNWVMRLTAVKAVASDFIKRRVGDRVGLILFGEQAYLQAPLTFDRATVNILLDEAAIGLAGKSTAIGDAIALAVKRLREQQEGNRALIVLTDGANTAGAIQPLKAAEIAKISSVKIYTIGVGADKQIRDVWGNVQTIKNSELDEETLTKIAEETGGTYFRARDLEALQEIYRKIDAFEPIAEDTAYYQEVKELFYLPLIIAILLSMGWISIMLALKWSKK